MDSFFAHHQFNQDMLIKCANKLGYIKDSEGMCRGFTMRWIEASLLGKEEDFKQRIKNIVILAKLLPRITINELEQNAMYKKKILDIRAFYESLLLYQEPDAYSDFFGSSLSQANIEEISELASSDKIRELGGIIQTKPLRYDTFLNFKSNTKRRNQFLTNLETSIEEARYEEPITFLVSCLGRKGLHAVSLTYNPAHKNWQFMDVNQFPPQAPEETLDSFYQALGCYMDYFFIRAILPNNIPAASLAETLSGLPKFSPDNQRLTQNNILYLAAKNDDIAVVKDRNYPGVPLGTKEELRTKRIDI